MVKKTNGTNNPMNTGALKRVMMALVVLLIASVLMVGAGSAEEPKTVYVTSEEDLEKNLTGVTNQTIIIELSAGTYSFPFSTIPTAGKNITFSGVEGTIIDLTNVATGQSTSGAEITFDNVNITFANENYKGLQHTKKVVYNNCKLTGKQHLYATDVEFINCTLENKNDYSVWTYGSANVVFTNCIFNTGGKAILVYNEKTTESFVSTIKLTNCIFNDDDTLDTTKAAVETGSNAQNTDTSNKYNIVFTDCTVNGFAVNDEGINTGSKLWGNKNSMDSEHLTVTIDGEKVVQSYTITWKDEDGQTLTSSKVKEGEMPTYTGSTPTKTANDTYTFQFAGWDPELAVVKGDATYKATFTPIQKEVKADVKVETTVEGNNVTIAAPVENAEVQLPAGITDSSSNEDVKTAVENAGNITIAGASEDTTKVVVNYDTTEVNSITVKEEGGHTLIVGKISNMTIVDPQTEVEIVMKYTDAVNATTNVSSGVTTVEGKPSAVVATYPEASIETSADVAVPVSFGLELTLDPEKAVGGNIELPTIEPTFNKEEAEKHAKAYGGVEPLAMIKASMPSGDINDINSKLVDGQGVTLTFTVPASVYAKKDEVYVLHIKSDGQTDVLRADNWVQVQGTTDWQFSVTGDGFSSYIAVLGEPKVADNGNTGSSSSSSSGSSVWLTETQTPTATPTPTETAQPTDTVPTDIPSTQPTATPASPGFGILAALAGLGAVAALRRQ